MTFLMMIAHLQTTTQNELAIKIWASLGHYMSLDWTKLQSRLKNMLNPQWGQRFQQKLLFYTSDFPSWSYHPRWPNHSPSNISPSLLFCIETNSTSFLVYSYYHDGFPGSLYPPLISPFFFVPLFSPSLVFQPFEICCEDLCGLLSFQASLSWPDYGGLLPFLSRFLWLYQWLLLIKNSISKKTFAQWGWVQWVENFRCRVLSLIKPKGGSALIVEKI